MKKNILLIVCLIFASYMNATVSKTVNVTTAGTLRTLLTTTEDTTVTNLTVTGSIDARDFKFMRDGITNLAVLDISAVTIQAYTGTGGTLTSATSYPAKKMPERSFYNITKLIAISIGNSVTSIGESAFWCCKGLTSITIPNFVTSIGKQAFGGCSGLTSITIPDYVTLIGDYTFFACSGLTSVAIPNSVTSIGDGAFYGCKGLTSITIPNFVTSIGKQAFGGCSGLTSITIPDYVTLIGDYAFEWCSDLTSVTIPNSVTLIGDNAFSNCSKLTSLYVYATTPVDLSLSPHVFAFVNVNACTLYVPMGSKSFYQSTPIWGDFNIVEMVATRLPTLVSESVNIYPNPVTDGFQINGMEGSGTLILTDLSGKVLLTKQVKTNEYVSVGFLPKGIYIVKIATEKGTIERKVLKR